MIQLFRYAAARFAHDQSANTSIEFVLLFPSVIAVFLSAFEAGFVMMRHITLDRGVDLAVRQLRLGFVAPLTHAEVKTRICNNAFLIRDCEDVLLLEMRPVSTTTWQPLNTPSACVDRTAAIQPVTTFSPGSAQEMVIMRACVIVDPFFPTTGLGLSLPLDASGGYALVSTTAFVNEPAS